MIQRFGPAVGMAEPLDPPDPGLPCPGRRGAARKCGDIAWCALSAGMGSCRTLVNQ